MNKWVNRKTFHWLSQVSGTKKVYIAALLLVQMILGIIGVAYALVIKEGIDLAVGKNFAGFKQFLIVFAGLVALQIICQAIARFLQEYARSGFENCFKERLFDALLRRDYSKVTEVHSGEWMNRLTSDTVVVADGMTSILPNVAGLFVRLIGALVTILIIEPKFGFVIIPGGLLLLLFSTIFRRKLKEMHKQVQESDGKVRMFLQEHIGSLMVVKSFVQEDDVHEEANARMEEHRKSRMRRNHFSNLCNIGFGVMMHGVYAIGVIYGGYGILMGTLSYGTFLAITQLISQMQMPFANISGYLPKFYAMLASAERLLEAEDYEEDYAQNESLSLAEVHKCYDENFVSMGLSEAAFSYSEGKDMVLQACNIDLKKGEYVAFTGASGCGKSTIMKLLMCLYSLDGGERYVTLRNADAAEVRTALTSQYRRLFAYVPQGNHLMSGTIREVVSFSNRGRREDDAAIWEALKIACADAFVEELPDGIDTVLGERGAGLSEGQMQRIAIARAIFADNPIILLDEATSALDEANEAKLLQNLRMLPNKMVLIVTHRPAALEICDRVIDVSK